VNQATTYRAITVGILPVVCPSCATRFDGSQTPDGVPWRCPRCQGAVARSAPAASPPPMPATQVAAAPVAAVPVAAAPVAAVPVAAAPVAAVPVAAAPVIAASVAAAPVAAVPVAAAPVAAVPVAAAPVIAASVASAPVAAAIAAPLPSPSALERPPVIKVMAIIAIVLASLDLLIGVGLMLASFSALSGGTARLWVAVVLSQAGFLGEFALLLTAGILLLQHRPRGRTLALVHALTVLPVFVAGTIAIRVAEALEPQRDGLTRPATWLMAAPFAVIFAVLLLILLNRAAVRGWAHRRRLELAGGDPAAPTGEALPVSELALWSAVGRLVAVPARPQPADRLRPGHRRAGRLPPRPPGRTRLRHLRHGHVGAGHPHGHRRIRLLPPRPEDLRRGSIAAPPPSGGGR